MNDPGATVWSEPLSQREVEILGLIAEGLSNREIAERLFLSVDTVKWYNKQLFSKLGVSSRTQAVSVARQYSLLESVKALHLEETHTQHNLPLQLTPFIGRETELAALDKLLANPDNRLVTIVGPGGMGKTRLALAAAESQLNRRSGYQTHPYQDGVYFVPLAQVGTPDRIVLALAEQLEVLFRGNTDPADQILEYLGKQRLLLIFDNFEHLMAGAEFIASILAHAPHVTMLVTSRERLLITGEAVLWLGGLAYPDEGDIELTTLEHAGTEYGAVSLFLHHARLIRPDLEFDQDRLTKVVRICRLVEGMPLAIILAVSWIEALSLEELAESIASSMDILASEQRDLPPRQRSIRAAFENSWSRLSPTDQDVFAKLSVFRGGFNRAAAQAVAGANLLTLRTLIEKSMLARANPDRYELHELLRQFGEGKLVVSGEQDKLEQAHGQYYLGYLNSLEADVKGQRQIEAFKEIEADLNNIQKAWAWGLKRGQFPLIDAALETLTLFCSYTSRANEAHGLFRATREKLIAGNEQRLLGRLLARHAWLRSEYGLETDSIQADLDKSWGIADQLEDQREMAMVQLARGYYHIRVHDDRAAGLVEFELAFQTCQALDDHFYMTILLTRIGYCQDDPALLIDFTGQSLRLAMETGNQYEAANARLNLGVTSILIGDTNSGEQMLHRALALETGTGSRIKYFPSNYLALAGFLRGDLDQMKRYLSLQEDVAIGKSTTFNISHILATRALLATVNGDLDIAEGLAHRSLNFPSNVEGKMMGHWALAMVSMDRGDLAKACQQLTAVYGIPNTTAYPGLMTWSLPVAALALARGGRFERAAQILSLALNHPASQVGWLENWSSGNALSAELEQILDSAAFKAAWEEGKSLDLAETIDWLGEEFAGEV